MDGFLWLFCGYTEAVTWINCQDAFKLTPEKSMATRIGALLLLFLCLSSAAASQTKIPTPAEVLAFTPGEDRKLASWDQVIDYFQRLDGASDRVVFRNTRHNDDG